VEVQPHQKVLAGVAANDDAGVYLLDERLALVQTVDFFTPIVDDGYTYGRIAAANALSDVYAMGARPITALNILGYPPDKVPTDIVAAILNGGADATAAADCALIGGHTVRNPEPIFGLAVTGVAAPDALLTKDRGRPGDALVLTKPLGTGIIATGLKRGLATDQVVEVAVASMTQLNTGGLLAAGLGVGAATDVTGFGLLGHLASICTASGCAAELWSERIPLLHEEVLALAAAGCVPTGSRDNHRAAAAFASWDSVDETMQAILTDAQTSGGLLLCVPPSRLADALVALHGTHIGQLLPTGPPQAPKPGPLIRVLERR
jgi:selenide,water dikinase